MPTWPEETIKPFMLDRPADWLVLLQFLWETTQTWKENKSLTIKISFTIVLFQLKKY